MRALDKELKNLIAECESKPQEWKPRIFDLSHVTDRSAIEQLIGNSPGLCCFDQLRSQLAELIETRHAGDDFTSEELQAAIDHHIAHQPYIEYGCWIYYPWSHRLVHALAEDEFRELRTSRNRNKITEEEQHTLLNKLWHTKNCAPVTVWHPCPLTSRTRNFVPYWKVCAMDTYCCGGLTPAFRWFRVGALAHRT